jgi:DNA-binding XRE family transcriptional regulator
VKRKGSYRKLVRPQGGGTRTTWSEYRRDLFNRNVGHAATVKFARIDADVTQKELGRILRVSTGAVTNRESGRVNLSIDNVKQHLEAVELVRDRRRPRG